MSDTSTGLGYVGVQTAARVDDLLPFCWDVRSPSKFLIEYGWGGRNIDPAHWQPEELTLGPSLWGHDRDWVSGEIMQEARRLRMAAAASGLRASLAVTTDADSMPGRHQTPRR